ncbi:prephenate dehydrogenase [Actinomyces vulturis]|uniref:prephenate dehydrogenase n=1 Tax=Actinomyces vulturis TaxID=1857645 RepID=UPI0009F5F604|nr:prephenate dehydrogenase [Actinomyces vulturis]
MSIRAETVDEQLPQLREVETPLLATTGPVVIIGTGLLGTSVALALCAGGVDVYLADASPTCQALAIDMGAGHSVDSLPSNDAVSIVVVATPPDVCASVIAQALNQYPNATVTDVASVKESIARRVQTLAGESLNRYVGSHPMAGRETSGPLAAHADLFAGRPWVIVPGQADSQRVLQIRTLAVDVAAAPITMEADKHDQAVAAISHLPQIMSSLLASRLIDTPATALSLAGQGLRDTTRIAASDERMWSSILTANHEPIVAMLNQVRSDMDELIEALEHSTDSKHAHTQAIGGVARLINAGNEGHSRIPGKHGGAPRRYAKVHVLVPDTVGQLGRLFADIAKVGVNIEDFAMEHSAGQKVGVAIVSVSPAQASPLEASLSEQGWRVARMA